MFALIVIEVIGSDEILSTVGAISTDNEMFVT